MTLIKFKNPNDVESMPYYPSFFGNFFNDFLNSDLVSKNVFRSVPAVNISESNERFMVELVSPGMQKEDFKIEVENGVMKIHAEKKVEKSDENIRFTRREFSYSTFSRTFNLPDTANADSISAEYENGLLKINIPKKEEAKPKPVKAITVS